LKSEESRGPMRVDEDARMKSMQVKRTRASNVVLSRDEASVAGGRHGRALCHKRREWKGGRMGKVRLRGCGEEAVVGLRGGGKGGGMGGGIGDRGWGTGLDLQLQEAEVTRVRQLRIYLYSTVVLSGHPLKMGHVRNTKTCARARSPPRSHLRLHAPYLLAPYLLARLTYLHSLTSCTPYLLARLTYLHALLNSVILTISGKASRNYKRDEYSDLRGCNRW
jgi:hypothetical protein